MALRCTGCCHSHIVVVCANDCDAFRMCLHDSFHSGGSAVSSCICVLYFIAQEGAACFFNASLVAVHTSGVGLVALYACDLNALDVGPSGSLGSLYSSLAALLGSSFVTGTYEGLNLRCREVGVDRNDRQLGAADQLRCRIRLQRRNNNAVIRAGAEVGLDHVLHFIECGLRAWTLNLYRNLVRMLGSIILSARLYILPVLGSQSLQDNADLVAAAGSGCATVITAVIGRGRIAAAACGHRQCHRSCQQHR